MIVDGTVSLNEPAINTSKDRNNHIVETHSLIAVNSVINGTVPGNSANILLAQAGGRLGDWNETAPDDPLVLPGERYILFLVPDERRSLPNTAGVPRYAAVGIRAGRVKVTKGRIGFVGPSARGLHTYDGADVNTFLAQLRQAISKPYTDSSLPIFPGPPK